MSSTRFFCVFENIFFENMKIFLSDFSLRALSSPVRFSAVHLSVEIRTYVFNKFSKCAFECSVLDSIPVVLGICRPCERCDDGWMVGIDHLKFPQIVLLVTSRRH